MYDKEASIKCLAYSGCSMCLLSFKKKRDLNVTNIGVYHSSGISIALHLIFVVFLPGRFLLPSYRGGSCDSGRGGGRFKVTQVTGYGAKIRMKQVGLQILILSRLFFNRQTTWSLPNPFMAEKTAHSFLVSIFQPSLGTETVCSWPPCSSVQRLHFLTSLATRCGTSQVTANEM